MNIHADWLRQIQTAEVAPPRPCRNSCFVSMSTVCAAAHPRVPSGNADSLRRDIYNFLLSNPHIETLGTPIRKCECWLPYFFCYLYRHWRGWLFDGSVNAYTWLLQERDDRLCAADRQRKPTHFISSYYSDKVSSSRA